MFLPDMCDMFSQVLSNISRNHQDNRPNNFPITLNGVTSHMFTNSEDRKRGKGSICCWFGASSKTRLAPVPRFILYWSFRHGISNYIRNMTPMQKQKPFGVIAAKDSIILVSRMDLY